MSKLSKYQPGFAQMHEAWRLACLVQVQHDTLAASRLHETISILKTTNPLHVLYWFNWFSYVQLYLHFSGASLMVYPPNTLCLNTKVTTPSAVPWLWHTLPQTVVFFPIFHQLVSLYYICIYIYIFHDSINPKVWLVSKTPCLSMMITSPTPIYGDAHRDARLFVAGLQAALHRGGSWHQTTVPIMNPI